jgi:hypothetical protein
MRGSWWAHDSATLSPLLAVDLEAHAVASAPHAAFGKRVPVTCSQSVNLDGRDGLGRVRGRDRVHRERKTGEAATASTVEGSGKGIDVTDTDRPTQALPGVNEGPICEGCGRPFRPVRTTQRHCRPSCRVLACRRRKAMSGSANLLSSGISAGHVEPDVMS